MSTVRLSGSNSRRARHARGFTLVELMVTVAIALFLLGGLVTIVQNVRQTNFNQLALSQLQDEQRFAMTVLTDVIQAGGYFPDATVWQPTTSLPAWGPFPQGQAFVGTHPAAGPDTLGVRYRTALNDGVILCDGSTNTALGPSHAYANQFTVVPPAGNVPGQLRCQLDNNAPVPLVNGVQGLTVYFGVKRNFAIADYNVDTYLTADQMLNTDWANVSSVRIVLTFTNPLCTVACPAGQQPTIQFERVVDVMARTGVHT
ncbi:MAG TPA: PilW family protein [Steroidobacteraceae bacterium]|jgi:type IV pilus assembly protein PilW|nr:PilW family protein [Steroidobacteraceae bacterium]